MGITILDVELLVGGNSFVLVVPLVHEQADGTLSQLWQIAVDEPGVFASEFDLTTEAQIVANKYAGSSNDPGGEHFVVAVPEPQDPGIIAIGLAALDFHQTEVSRPIMRQ